MSEGQAILWSVFFILHISTYCMICTIEKKAKGGVNENDFDLYGNVKGDRYIPPIILLGKQITKGKVYRSKIINFLSYVKEIVARKDY